MAICIFVIPRVPCLSLPPVLSQYCPPHANTPAPGVIPVTSPLPQVYVLRNVASSASGARPLQQLCQIPDQIQSSWIPRFLRSAEREDHCAGAIATLNDAMDYDQCWTFPGREAQLAIRLSAPSGLSRIVLAQPTPMKSYTSSPRNVTVWGMVEGLENIERLVRQPMLRSTLQEYLPKSAHPPVLLNKIFLPLASFTYRLHSSAQQEFPVYQELQDASMEFSFVVFQFHNNWGSRLTTICHLGILSMSSDVV